MKNQFETKKEVIDFLSEVASLDAHSEGERFSNNNPLFCLRHGEYSRPDYFPARYKDGWGVKVEYCFYAGTCHAPKNGRLDDELFTELFLVETAL
ncbi:MAG: hypothetical protein IBX56_20280 [Methylomicrobium sp.]|nr:hypothetical protein [Methylomicrobium sp.]